MISMAKAIASNATVVLKFAHVIAEQCVDERWAADELTAFATRAFSFFLIVCKVK